MPTWSNTRPRLPRAAEEQRRTLARVGDALIATPSSPNARSRSRSPTATATRTRSPRPLPRIGAHPGSGTTITPSFGSPRHRALAPRPVVLPQFECGDVRMAGLLPDGMVPSIPVRGVGIAITPDGSTAYVAGSGDVTPITVATDAAGTPVFEAQAPLAVAITPGGETAYVTNFVPANATVTPIAIPRTRRVHRSRSAPTPMQLPSLQTARWLMSRTLATRR